MGEKKSGSKVISDLDKIISELAKLNLSGVVSDNYSSEEIEELITKLDKAKKKAKKREEEEEREIRKKEEIARQEAHVQEVTCMDLPLDWNNVFNSDERTQGVHTESIPDALIMSLTTLGKVDIEYISSITGADYKTVICALKGSIYQNPVTWGECFYKGWETAEEYLSGNLMRKWKAAKEADKTYNGYFRANVTAIEKVLPPTIPADDIYITLGSPWVPSDIIDDFILHLFGEDTRKINYGAYYIKEDQDLFRKTRHDEITGTWEIPEKDRYGSNIAVTNTYGTKKIGALHILEKTLNMKTVSVTEVVSCPSNASGKKRVISKDETVAALEKQQKLIL